MNELDKHKLLFKSIVGSTAYGTNIATSDIDYKGVYIQKNDDILGFNYKQQIDVTKDETYYEVKRFLELLQTANPTVLELLFSPLPCIVKTTTQFEMIVAVRNKFLTKQCRNSFGGYARAQISKSNSLNKKMNWEQSKTERKTPLDFVYVYEDGKTLALSTWLSDNNLIQEYCGLAALNHFPNCYALYYGTMFRGIAFDDSNTIHLSSIPKGMKPLGVIFYNKDGYSIHCKEYLQYTKWLEERNTARYVDTATHGQQIDGKNLLHCRRLLDVSIQIATEGTFTVLRPNADELLKIRRGEVVLDKIIEKAEEDIALLDDLYAKSGLPDSVDPTFVNDLLLEIRHYKG